jgi:hypothetical protein
MSENEIPNDPIIDEAEEVDGSDEPWTPDAELQYLESMLGQVRAVEEGFSKRDMFATAALQALAENRAIEGVAKLAYRYADAMLEARKTTK